MIVVTVVSSVQISKETFCTYKGTASLIPVGYEWVGEHKEKKGFRVQHATAGWLVETAAGAGDLSIA